MRADPTDYQLVCPGSLPAVLSLLAEEPAAWLPIAGGTDVMVQYSAGRLPRGERRVPYTRFHLEYRKTRLRPDELIRAVCLPRRFSGYYAHARKVAARKAQAIAKVCFAALGRLEKGTVEDVRLAMGSVAPVPLRLSETEGIVKGRPIDPALIRLASRTAAREIRPIDDIRSTARYRAAVAGNLVAEFLDRLSASETNQ